MKASASPQFKDEPKLERWESGDRVLIGDRPGTLLAPDYRISRPAGGWWVYCEKRSSRKARVSLHDPSQWGPEHLKDLTRLQALQAVPKGLLKPVLAERVQTAIEALQSKPVPVQEQLALPAEPAAPLKMSDCFRIGDIMITTYSGVPFEVVEIGPSNLVGKDIRNLSCKGHLGYLNQMKPVADGVARRAGKADFVVRVSLEEVEATGAMARYSDDWGPINEAMHELARRTLAALLPTPPAPATAVDREQEQAEALAKERGAGGCLEITAAAREQLALPAAPAPSMAPAAPAAVTAAPALRVDCPSCGAKKGQICRTPGLQKPLSSFHRDRMRIEAGLPDTVCLTYDCPECKAVAGTFCTRPSGGTSTSLHHARQDLAQATAQGKPYRFWRDVPDDEDEVDSDLSAPPAAPAGKEAPTTTSEGGRVSGGPAPPAPAGEAPAPCGRPSDGKRSPWRCWLPRGHQGKHRYTDTLCGEEAPSGGNYGPRQCYRPAGHTGKHQYIEVPHGQRLADVVRSMSSKTPAAAPAPLMAPAAPAAPAVTAVPALRVACPFCEAKIGEPCSTMSGPRSPHRERGRAEAALPDTACLLHDCPACKAPAGKPCRRPSGGKAPIHHERQDLAEARALGKPYRYWRDSIKEDEEEEEEDEQAFAQATKQIPVVSWHIGDRVTIGGGRHGTVLVPKGGTRRGWYIWRDGYPAKLCGYDEAHLQRLEDLDRLAALTRIPLDKLPLPGQRGLPKKMVGLRHTVAAAIKELQARAGATPPAGGALRCGPVPAALSTQFRAGDKTPLAVDPSARLAGAAEEDFEPGERVKIADRRGIVLGPVDQHPGSLWVWLQHRSAARPAMLGSYHPRQMKRQDTVRSRLEVRRGTVLARLEALATVPLKELPAALAQRVRNLMAELRGKPAPACPVPPSPTLETDDDAQRTVPAPAAAPRLAARARTGHLAAGAAGAEAHGLHEGRGPAAEAPAQAGPRDPGDGSAQAPTETAAVPVRDQPAVERARSPVPFLDLQIRYAREGNRPQLLEVLIAIRQGVELALRKERELAQLWEGRAYEAADCAEHWQKLAKSLEQKLATTNLPQPAREPAVADLFGERE